MKKSSAVLVLLVAAIAFSAAERSTARSDLTDFIAAEKIEEAEIVPPLCCNECGICDRRAPEFARCECEDWVRSCHPDCRNCLVDASITQGIRYRCLDMSYDACHSKCPEPALQAIIVS
ncbi:uncharacterized protein A4U43_C05F2850 [Asparagus officinalis]|uniref:Bowman-Birk serine protease inhibitors family domain-containing protein n=1 Tax=Asparagus officinalis TaxID=4686 RepID=A0A5P1EPX5_ASPOF|nr:seed trypsin/chymotrypsin inhibitor IVA-like [Asparagus officinalis]ONK67703.1 uncharacterized protein A4U43_C05F2850 [Asparagus officinalis]